MMEGDIIEKTLSLKKRKKDEVKVALNTHYAQTTTPV